MNLEFKEGDLITAYVKGYHRCVKIEPRFKSPDTGYPTGKGEPMSPLIYYQQIFTSNGKLKSSKTSMCDASFCELASTHIKREIENLENTLSRFKQILNDIEVWSSKN